MKKKFVFSFVALTLLYFLMSPFCALSEEIKDPEKLYEIALIEKNKENYDSARLFFQKSIANGIRGEKLAKAYGGSGHDFVNDYAKIINGEESSQLDPYLKNLKNDEKVNLSILTIESLRGENIEDFSSIIFNSWGLGESGVLIVVAKNERRIRIELGYDLALYISNASCGKVIEDIISPRFKEGNFAKGLEEGARAIGNFVKAQPKTGTAKK